jgi:hypothetical protein
MGPSTRDTYYSQVMPRIVGRLSGNVVLTLVILALVLGFTPISKVLLKTVNGSFAPARYSSLALEVPSDAISGIRTGVPFHIQLTNRTGHDKTYLWSATEGGILVSLGQESLTNGQSASISVPTRDAVTGRLRVALTGTDIFLTVPIFKS